MKDRRARAKVLRKVRKLAEQEGRQPQVLPEPVCHSAK